MAVLEHSPITEAIIGAAIEVHRVLGPGLLESAYEDCLCHELELRGVRFRRQVPVGIVYKGSLLRAHIGSISWSMKSWL